MRGTTCQRVCRTAALRVACAYRRVSDIALSVIAGMPPIDLIVAEKAKIHREGKLTEEDDVNQERSHNRCSSKEWQRRWTHRSS